MVMVVYRAQYIVFCVKPLIDITTINEIFPFLKPNFNHLSKKQFWQPVRTYFFINRYIFLDLGHFAYFALDIAPTSQTTLYILQDYFNMWRWMLAPTTLTAAKHFPPLYFHTLAKNDWNMSDLKFRNNVIALHFCGVWKYKLI